MPAVQRGEVPVGLLIHEGRLTYSARAFGSDGRIVSRRWRMHFQFGRGIDLATAERFVGIYVNELTLCQTN
jgi:predicted solute-binding protein